jgi:hypothetical protein
MGTGGGTGRGTGMGTGFGTGGGIGTGTAADIITGDEIPAEELPPENQ